MPEVFPAESLEFKIASFKLQCKEGLQENMGVIGSGCAQSNEEEKQEFEFRALSGIKEEAENIDNLDPQAIINEQA